MSLSKDDQTQIREYLLGYLSEEEHEKIEQRLMVDEEMFEELEVSKGELIEEYCAGELPQRERHWFERHYLASSEGRQRYTLAIAIGKLSGRERVEQSPTFVERLRAFWSKPQWAAASVVSIVLVGVVAFVWVRSIQGPRTIVPVVLTNSLLSRGNGENVLPFKVKLPPDASELKASLIVPKPFPQGTRFEAVLDNQVDRKSIRVIEHKDNTVTVSIPATELPPGKYSLELTAFKVDGTEESIPGSYRFDINYN